MIDISKEEKKFNDICAGFENDIRNIRAGRTHVSMVESVKVEVYGSAVPLSSVASISTPDPKSIVISPWDKSVMPAIEQAISRANLGLGISADKEQIRLIMQPVTEEKRKELVKILGKKEEEVRITVRRVRDELWKLIQNEHQENKISEDQKFSLKDKMEEAVGKINAKIADIAKRKEQEIMII